MTSDDRDHAVELLQDLGLKTYEARCFTALSQLEQGTAKDISEITDVPRTRVYDAMESLQSRGLVEIHHGSPQRYRSLPLDEALATIREQFDSRIERLEDRLESLDAVTLPDEELQEVWFLSGEQTIENRMETFIDEATSSIRFVLEDPGCWSPGLEGALRRALDRGIPIDLYVAAGAEAAIPAAIIDGASIHSTATEPADQERIGLLTVDGDAVVLRYHPRKTGQSQKAIYAEGGDTGLFVLSNRYLVSIADV